MVTENDVGLSWLPPWHTATGGAAGRSTFEFKYEGFDLTVKVDTDRTGRLVVAGLALTPAGGGRPPDGGISTERWRAISMSQLTKYVLDEHRQLAELDREISGERDTYADREEVLALFAKRTGTRPRDDYAYARLAEEFTTVIEHNDAKPVDALANWLDTPRATIAARLQEARRRGLLTSVGRGAPGGKLTAKARYVLGKRRTTRPGGTQR